MNMLNKNINSYDMCVCACVCKGETEQDMETRGQRGTGKCCLILSDKMLIRC